MCASVHVLLGSDFNVNEFHAPASCLLTLVQAYQLSITYVYVLQALLLYLPIVLFVSQLQALLFYLPIVLFVSQLQALLFYLPIVVCFTVTSAPVLPANRVLAHDEQRHWHGHE